MAYKIVPDECPRCESSDITGEEFDFDGNCRRVQCDSCGLRWREDYEYTGFEIEE